MGRPTMASMRSTGIGPSARATAGLLGIPFRSAARSSMGRITGWSSGGGSPGRRRGLNVSAHRASVFPLPFRPVAKHWATAGPVPGAPVYLIADARPAVKRYSQTLHGASRTEVSSRRQSQTSTVHLSTNCAQVGPHRRGTCACQTAVPMV